MKYLKQEITDYLVSNLTETVLDWSDATSYVTGDEVKLGNFIYKSATDSNLGNSPDEYMDIKWLRVRASNKYAMLELRSQTKSKYDGSLSVTFAQNRMNTLAIGNYFARDILVEVLDGLDVVMWSGVFGNSIAEYVTDWWTYIYEPFGIEVNRAVKVDLGYNGSKVRVTFNMDATATYTECGYFVGGTTKDMGKTLEGVNFKFNSFTTKEFNVFGDLNIIKRSTQDLVDFNTLIATRQIQAKKRDIKSIYNDVVVFIVDDVKDSKFENAMTLGVVQDSSTVLSNFDLTTIAWSVVEVI